MTDRAFRADRTGLRRALEILLDAPAGRSGPSANLPDRLPDQGLGEAAVLDRLAPLLLDGAADLAAPTAFAHMDPPTPWISWALAQWTASRNQNLLHPDTAPHARALESRVVDWLAPWFGMAGGHMTPGSTVANLTALWVARQVTGARRVVASDAAHLSIRKAADILAMDYVGVAAGPDGRLDPAQLPSDLGDACLVLTAGTTSTGAIDDLSLCGRAGWVHVDAAWAGPLRLSDRHAPLLDGIDRADSVAVSAHKWLFQPKESALVLFSDAALAHASIGYGGAYLATPNIGLLGSHGATAAVLLGTLLAFGRTGIARWIDRGMETAGQLAASIGSDPRLDLWAPPVTGVLVWRAADSTRTDDLLTALPSGMASRTQIEGQAWLRQVAANPVADREAMVAAVQAAAAGL